MFGHGAVPKEGEVVHEGPGNEDVGEAEGRRPAGAESNDEQERTDEVRKEGNEESERGPEVKKTGKVGHKGKPLRGALLPPVAQEKSGAGGDAENGEAQPRG